MIEVVYNTYSGGAYGLSKAACEFLGLNWEEELRKKQTDSIYFPSQICARPFENDRSNPLLLKCVKELGQKAAAEFCTLEIYSDNDADDFVIISAEDSQGYQGYGAELVIPIFYRSSNDLPTSTIVSDTDA